MISGGPHRLVSSLKILIMPGLNKGSATVPAVLFMCGSNKTLSAQQRFKGPLFIKNPYIAGFFIILVKSCMASNFFSLCYWQI